MTDLPELRRITVRPGDIYVLEVPASTTSQAAQRMSEKWRAAVGDVPLLITSGRLTCYRPVDPEDGPNDASPGAVCP